LERVNKLEEYDPYGRASGVMSQAGWVSSRPLDLLSFVLGFTGTVQLAKTAKYRRSSRIPEQLQRNLSALETYWRREVNSNSWHDFLTQLYSTAYNDAQSPVTIKEQDDEKPEQLDKISLLEPYRGSEFTSFRQRAANTGI
jgi:hypothetical protein